MRIPSNKIKDIVRFFREELKGVYDDSEVETFIAYCFEDFLSMKRFEINERANDTISETELLKFNFAIKDLKNHKPIQYILGKADFYGMKLLVNEQVLIPRQETEELVQLVLTDFTQTGRSGASVLDIGTGSGCIAIALKKNLPAATVYALDVSEQALAVAQKNAAANNVNITFIKGDILAVAAVGLKIEEKLDIIVSNPPYIRELEKQQMHKNVLEYEPHIALFVMDEDPLIFYKAITDFTLQHLKPEGKLYLEINENLGEETGKMLLNKGFKNVNVFKDINGKNRILRCVYR